MRKILVFAIALLFVVILSTPKVAEAADLFSDGFESDDFTNWTSAGSKWSVINGASGAHSGTKRAEVKGGGATNDSLLKQISTTGNQNISLSYWYKINSALESSDHVVAEWSVDGSSWTTLADYAGLAAGAWTQETFNLPSSADDSTNFQFRFRATLNAGNDEFELDDVELIGSFIPTPTPTATPTPTLTPSDTPTPTPTPTATPTPSATPSATPTPTTTPTPYIQIDTINGSSGPFTCEEGSPFPNLVEITGSGLGKIPPGQVDQYYIQITWGDSTIDDAVSASFSTADNDGYFTFNFEASHSYTTDGSVAISPRLYHSTPPGNDGAGSTASSSSTVCVEGQPSPSPTPTASPTPVPSTDVIVTKATGGEAIPDTTVGGAFTQLTGPTITEQDAGQIGSGSFMLNIPSGFIFDDSAIVTASISNYGNCNGEGNAMLQVGNPAVTSTTITIDVQQSSRNNCYGGITFAGIGVQPTAVASVSGDIMASGTSVISGVTASTSFGTLTETLSATPTPTPTPTPESGGGGGGGSFNTPTPTPTPSASPTPTATPTPSGEVLGATATPTPRPQVVIPGTQRIPTPTPTPTPAPSVTPTPPTGAVLGETFPSAGFCSATRDKVMLVIALLLIPLSIIVRLGMNNTQWFAILLIIGLILLGITLFVC
ncbi:MAG: choice-of-anchor J domain-containing protein [Patescibacteria group bacterium]